jgi:drug/metabolite transporter (DMT)-like permease
MSTISPPAPATQTKSSLASSQAQAPGWLVWVALWTVYIVWGSTYLAIRITLETLPPLLTAGLRFTIAGPIVLLVLRLKKGRGSTRITGPQLRSCAVIGVALLLGGNGLVTLAERTVPSALTALIIASVPLWVVLLRFISKERVATGTLIGVAIGFVGVSVLVMPGNRPAGATISGMLLIVLAAASWAIGSFISPKLTLPKDPFVSTGYQMIAGGAALALTAAMRGEFSGIDVSSFSAASVWAFVYLIVAGSLLAFTAYVWLLQNAPISKVATYAYVNPVIAIFLGWLILDEAITSYILIGAAVIVASVAVIVRRESAKSSH